MKSYELDAQAIKFKQIGNEAFGPIAEHYRLICRKWLRYINRFTRVDKDDFYEKFYLLLYRSLIKYNPEYEDTDTFSIVNSRFDRYFYAAVNKLCITYKRNAAIQWEMPKNTEITKETLNIPSLINDNDMVVIEDIISVLKDPIDRQIIKLRVENNSRQDICDDLHLELHEYRSRLGRIKTHPSIVSLLNST